MNEYKEALSFFVRDRKFSFEEAGKMIKYKDILQELIDKETPRKPKLNGRYCGKCGIVRLLPTDNYCSNCGQKIDWGIGDE